MNDVIVGDDTLDFERTANFCDLGMFEGLFYASREGPAAMKRLKSYDLYRLGTIRQLRELNWHPADSDATQDLSDNLAVAVLALRRFVLEHREDLKGAAAQANTVVEQIRVIGKQIMAGLPLNFHVPNLISALSKFENLLEYDLERQHAYVIEKVGIFDTDDLIERAQESLSDSAIDVVNPSVIRDINQAGRCLAFDLSTACGFHCVRAVEETTRQLYQIVTGKDATVEKKTLGGMAEDFDKEITKNKYPTDSLAGLVVFNLKRINNLYRKPVTHPEMTLDSVSDAKKIFDLTQATISLIGEAIITCKFAP